MHNPDHVKICKHFLVFERIYRGNHLKLMGDCNLMQIHFLIKAHLSVSVLHLSVSAYSLTNLVHFVRGSSASDRHPDLGFVTAFILLKFATHPEIDSW